MAKPRQYMAHDTAVRMYSLISSINKNAFRKSAKTITTMETRKSIFEPIQLVQLDNKKVILRLGTQRLTDKEFADFKEANNYLKRETYEVCLHICSMLIWLNEQSKQQNNEHKTNK